MKKDVPKNLAKFTRLRFANLFKKETGGTVVFL